ncbi:MAG: hypothetical protein LLG13_12025 [Bacteroidales bacterium]|nr:hypothetical protein [Bacteroidales bacterium]
MDGFSYNNIFDTKGIEYLILIAFLLIIIPFWIALNRKTGKTKQGRRKATILSAAVLRILRGLYYSKNHTWSCLGKSGVALIGLDNFLFHITGRVKFINLKKSGDFINKGDLIIEIEQNEKSLKIFSPLSGEIISTNTFLNERSWDLKSDPYEEGWIYRIRPAKWKEETESLYLADAAIEWSEKELVRFKELMILWVKKYSVEPSKVISQESGEIFDQPLSELPGECWQEFQKYFLS